MENEQRNRWLIIKQTRSQVEGETAAKGTAGGASCTSGGGEEEFLVEMLKWFSPPPTQAKGPVNITDIRTSGVDEITTIYNDTIRLRKTRLLLKKRNQK